MLVITIATAKIPELIDKALLLCVVVIPHCGGSDLVELLNSKCNFKA